MRDGRALGAVNHRRRCGGGGGGIEEVEAEGAEGAGAVFEEARGAETEVGSVHVISRVMEREGVTCAAAGGAAYVGILGRHCRNGGIPDLCREFFV